jgi:putative ABC transport system substrate-binding protein
MSLGRREFITLFGGAAAAWPLPAGAQQPAVPLIGFLGSTSPDTYAPLVTVFREGLKANGLIEDQNLGIEWRWAQDRQEQLPGLAADLVRHKVAVIVASGGGVTALAAKAATQTIPIVFVNGSDPIKNGLVASINRPGGNVTGVSLLSVELEAKRFELLHELVPKAVLIAFLTNPHNPDADLQLETAQVAARAIGQQVLPVNASSEREFDNAFATLVQQRAEALVVATDPLFVSRHNDLTLLAERYAVPAIYAGSQLSPDAGGLLNFGVDVLDAYGKAANYVARILRGTTPADLPVLLPTKFELVINLRTARALGLNLPPTLLILADKVIE